MSFRNEPPDAKFMDYVQRHERIWGTETYSGRPDLVDILTAPVVVASWISLQYYGSTVAPDLFGSGNKLLHNVVGGIGRLRMETLVRGVMPFFLIYLVIVGLLIAVPSIITVPLAWLR